MVLRTYRSIQQGLLVIIKARHLDFGLRGAGHIAFVA